MSLPASLPGLTELRATDQRLAEILLIEGYLTEDQLRDALEEHTTRQPPVPLAVHLIELGFLPPEELTQLLEKLRDVSREQGETRAGVVMRVIQGEDRGRAFIVPTCYPSVVGRGAHVPIKLSDPFVSREHCLLDVEGDTVSCTHLAGRSDTLVNGRVIEARTPIGTNDRITIGRTVFALVSAETDVPEATVATELDDAAPESHGVRVEAVNVSRVVRNRDTGQPLKLLDEIDFVIHPGEFVVILGPSGSGKSTLMNALNGRRRATSGQILYDGLDLYADFDLFRTQMGYVPQQDIVHTHLSVRRALYYTAKLRLPVETSNQEVEQTIQRIARKMGLEERLLTRIGNLSGGQIKRVSLGSELVSNPTALFLDEATSGLDAGTERRMMTLFRRVADMGKTVVCVTHNLENINQADLVVVVDKGKLVYYGPPDQVAEHFGCPSVADLYDRLEDEDAQVWRDRYDASPLHAQYVENRRARRRLREQSEKRAEESGVDRERTLIAVRDNKPAQSLSIHLTKPALSAMHQFRYLTLRYLESTLRDTRNLTLLLLQAPLIALVVAAVFDDAYLLMFLMTISAVWFGCINASKEIVKEQEIYKRERMVNLKLLPYVLSKLVLLVGLSAIQCLMLLAIIRAQSDLSGPFGLQWLSLWNASVGGLFMGLLVSSLVNSTDKALAIVPLVVIPQIVYTVNPAIGVAFTEVNQVVAEWTILAYWAFDALRTSEVMTIAHDYGVDLVPEFVKANVIQVLMHLVLFAGILLALKRKDYELVQ